MNGKRIAALAALAALLTSGSAYAANPTQTVTIKWNTQQLATLNVFTNYTAAAAQGLSAPAIWQNVNAGTGSCTANGNGSEVAQTVNFGNVTPDGTKYTDCLYQNAVIAQYATNDANGYSLTAVQTTAPTHATSVMLCYLPNGSQTSATVVQSTRISNALVPSLTTVVNAANSCGAGNSTLWGTSATLASGAGATAGTQWAAGDIELVLAPSAASGADQQVDTWTLVLN